MRVRAVAVGRAHCTAKHVRPVSLSKKDVLLKLDNRVETDATGHEAVRFPGPSSNTLDQSAVFRSSAARAGNQRVDTCPIVAT